MTAQRRRHRGLIPYPRTHLLLVAGALIAWLIAGCGGTEVWDEPGPYPRYHNITVVLNVSDVSGEALGDATVWVNGVAQDEKTAWTLTTLGSGYPESWRGYKANWIKGGFVVDTFEDGGYGRVEVIVSKEGYYSEKTRFSVGDELPEEVFARETFILERNPAPLGATLAPPRERSKPGEVVGVEKKKATSQLPSMYKLT